MFKNGGSKFSRIAIYCFPILVGAGVALGRFFYTGAFDLYLALSAALAGYLFLALAVLPVMLHGRSGSAAERRED